MPIYEFECPNGKITAKLVKVGTITIRCPSCHKKAKKIMSTCTFELKGGGWYADGYSHQKEGKNAKKRG
jgi:putative FmdB family regulatory protein